MSNSQEDKNFLREAVETWRSARLIDYVAEDLETRIKKDHKTKLSVFSAGASAYLPEPINLFLKGESGIGKTYNTVQTLTPYFPEEDLWLLGGASPKSLIHDYGMLLDKDGEKIDLDEAPQKPRKGDFSDETEYREALESYRDEAKDWQQRLRESYTLIDLSHKILVFLEAPEYETMRMLYPILSHDNRRIEYRFVEKTGRGQLRTAKVIIQGWPAAIFLSTDRDYIAELATRGFTVTPDNSEEKISEANKLTNFKAGLPWQNHENTKESKVIKALIRSLKRQFTTGNFDVAIPFLNLHELFPREIVRDMRDFQHFIQFLKTIVALNMYQRPFLQVDGKKFVVASAEDVKDAFDVFREIFETTRTGTEQQVLDFYYELVHGKESVRVAELVIAYNQRPSHKRKVSDYTLRKWLDRLNEIGYIEKSEDKNDKRVNVYRPLVMEKPKLCEITCVSENPVILRSKLEEGFKTWKENIRNEHTFYKYEKISDEKWTEQPISMNEVEKQIFSSIFEEDVFQYSNKDELAFSGENKPEITCVSENPVISHNSLTVKEVIEKIRPVFVEDSQEQFQRLAMQVGNLTETEAERLFTRLVDDGKLGMTPEGLWKWC